MLDEVESAHVGSYYKVIAKAFQAGAKTHLRKARLRLKSVARAKVWDQPKKDGPVVGLKPEKWSSAVGSAAKLYIELGKTLHPYVDLRISVDALHDVWRAHNPLPVIGELPTERALAEVEATIRQLQADNLDVPWSLHNSASELREAARKERAAAEAAAYKKWDAKRKAGFAANEKRFVKDNAAFLAFRSRVRGALDDLKRLMYEAQRAEEKRLEAWAVSSSKDAKLAEKVAALLKEMDRGRKKAVLSTDTRWSRYGSLLRQGWMIHRTKLINAVRGAVRREKAAAKKKAEAEKGGG